MTVSKEIRYLSAAIPELENYLLSKELYYPVGMNHSQLTLGNVLLSIMRAGAQARQFETKADAVRLRWRTAWDVKSSREVEARRVLWSNYLSEYKADPRSESRLYPQNVRYRAILALLGQGREASDGFLKSAFIEGGFVWEEESASNFEREKFWFLFGRLKQEK